MNITKKIIIALFVLITSVNSSLYSRNGWGGFAAGALTGAAVTGVAVAASRPHYNYSESTYHSAKKCRKAVRTLEEKNDELYTENRRLKRENNRLAEKNEQLQQEIDELSQQY